jgi:hypothetical protein
VLLARRPGFVTTGSSPMFQFDVALSFAGEDRVYTGDIAERLRSHDVRVFYDEYEQAIELCPRCA